MSPIQTSAEQATAPIRQCPPDGAPIREGQIARHLSQQEIADSSCTGGTLEGACIVIERAPLEHSAEPGRRSGRVCGRREG